MEVQHVTFYFSSSKLMFFDPRWKTLGKQSKRHRQTLEMKAEQALVLIKANNINKKLKLL